MAVLASTGITTPFPIQAATLPDALDGRDILGRGRTGSGKTLGFSLPLAARLAGGHTMACRPRGLVLVPTRELASQVQAVLVPLARAMGLSVTSIFGGVSQHPQVAALRDRADIVVACPGRLTDLIEQGHCHLGDVEISVIDEADHMADLGFLPVVKRLLDSTPPDGQRMLFSATLDKAVDVLARRFLDHPARHAVDSAAPPAEIVHHLLSVAPADRVGRLKVEPDLTVPGQREIFAIGDAAVVLRPDGQPVPGIAPAAKQEGVYVADVIRARLRDAPAPPPFRYKHAGDLATIGKRRAVIDFGWIKLRGTIAWWLWGFAHIYFLIGVRNRLNVALNWLWIYVRDQRGARLITWWGGEVEGTEPFSRDLHD